jgi:ribonuclease J
MQFIRPKIDNRNKLKIISLGGFGNVTTNMYVYELEPQGDIMLIDCGIGFPSQEMLGVDLLIPDTSYLRDKKDKIRGLVLSHGHDDHTGALPYILPRLPFPVYSASPLTSAFAEIKLQDSGLTQRVITVDPSKVLKLGPFNIEFIRINHSTPDAFHIFINTPAGNIYHGPDYKFDWTPVDGKKPEVVKIAQIGSKGITLMLTDCLGAENKGATPTELTLNQMFQREIGGWKGRIMITTLSSNISRFQQAIEASIQHGRKVALVGRSLDKKIEVATKLGYLKFGRNIFVTPEQSLRMPDQEVTLLVSGSQGQEGSAMDRIADEDHKYIKIKKNDKVIFSSPDYIPGTENAVHDLIDRLTILGATVVYADIAENLHVGGHGGQLDMKWLLGLAQPKFIVPTGGETRHMKQYSLMAQSFGYPEGSILLPRNGDIVEMTSDGVVQIKGKLDVRNVMVDGLGVGDVGNVVLRDRQVLSEEGIVIVVAQIDQTTGELVDEADVISRGFIYSKSNEELIFQAKKEVKKVLISKGKHEIRLIRETISDRLERFFFDKTGRRPMILPVIVEI